MPTTPMASRPLHLSPTHRHLGQRALQSLLLGAVVAVFLSVVFGNRFGYALVYSECIAMSSWAFIDGGRMLAARWVHRPRPGKPVLDNKVDWPGWPWMVACVLIGTLAGASLGYNVADWLLGIQSPRSNTSLRGAAAVLLFSLVPAVGVTYFFWSRSRLQALQARAEAAQRLAAENQLRLLESQLEPHMLFNTLANLRVLIGLDPPRAQLMLDRLIGFLRATLSASRVSQHPLSQEFARVADYLALMKVRMGDRLQEELLLPDALARHPVPPLLLQPLVENAIKHGLEPHVDGGRLSVSAALEGGQLVLRVRDTGAGLPSTQAPDAATAGTGFGLQQVRERLATLYGEAARFDLAPADPLDAEGGTLATIRLPAAPPPTDSDTDTP